MRFAKRCRRGSGCVARDGAINIFLLPLPPSQRSFEASNLLAQSFEAPTHLTPFTPFVRNAHSLYELYPRAQLARTVKSRNLFVYLASFPTLFENRTKDKVIRLRAQMAQTSIGYIDLLGASDSAIVRIIAAPGPLTDCDYDSFAEHERPLPIVERCFEQSRVKTLLVADLAQRIASAMSLRAIVDAKLIEYVRAFPNVYIVGDQRGYACVTLQAQPASLVSAGKEGSRMSAYAARKQRRVGSFLVGTSKLVSANMQVRDLAVSFPFHSFHCTCTCTVRGGRARSEFARAWTSTPCVAPVCMQRRS